MPSRSVDLFIAVSSASLLFAISCTNVLADDNMLAWCAKSYPNKIEWCKKQYPGEVAVPSPQAVAPPIPPAEPQTGAAPVPSEHGSSYDTLMARLRDRSAAAPSAINIGANGQFGARASEIVNTLRTLMRDRGLQFDWDGDCNEQSAFEGRDAYLDCSIDGNGNSLTVSAAEPSSGRTTDRVEITQVVEESKDRPNALFELAVTVDTLSRILDSDLTDRQRAGVFTAAVESYFASGRKSGTSYGRRAKYVITEEGGNITVILFAVAPDSSRAIPESTAEPIIALATAMNQSNLIKPDPLQAPEVQAKITQRRTLVKAMIAKLDGFRYDKQFQDVGFSSGYRYRQWYEKIRDIHCTNESDIVKSACEFAGVTKIAFSLYDMAWDYMHHQGRDTDETRRTRVDIRDFLDGRRP